MKKLFSFIFLLSFFTFGSADEIQRKVLVIYPNSSELNSNAVHLHLESILNYYGYYAEHLKDEPRYYPDDISSYAGVIYWNQGLTTQDPVRLVKFLARFKNKKNIIIGDIPVLKRNGKNYVDTVNQILKENFGFYFGKIWRQNPQNVKRKYDTSLFGFEMKISFINQKNFTQVLTSNPKHQTVFKETYNNFESQAAFFAPWGFYGANNKVFYHVDDEDKKIEGKNRWLIDPFKLIERVYATNYPIPDTTTKNGKRIAYIHIDGDGILSTSFNQKYTIENGYEFIKKEGFKTGVSYVVSELDKDGPILSYNPLLKKSSKRHDYKLLNNFAKKILELPFVEPATHTYSHPYNWRKGIVAYSNNPKAKIAMYEGIRAYQEPDRQVNLSLEIRDSINYIQKLIPSKKVRTVYWSGDCYPSLRDLKYIEDNNLLAFNNGDSRFDLEYNSYSYVTPLSLYSSKGTQIYSSNSNENTYTNLWTANFWRFKNVIKTFENTGYPKRIKPANTYYHFYSFEKKGAHNALKKIYQYYRKNNFEFIYPSEFISIAKNFHDIIIKKVNNTFIVSNIKDLREFRFKGRPTIQSEEIASIFYDKKLDVTYIRLKGNVASATIEVNN